MKRANGEGTIYQNKYGTWTAQFTAPSGERPSRTFSTQRKALTWLTLQKHDLDTGNYVAPTETTLGAWWDTWSSVYKAKSVTEVTRETYRTARARLPDDLLNKPLGQITHADIQAAINAVKGKRRTAEITLTNLKMCMARAVMDGLLRQSPCKNIELPPHDEKEGVPLDADEYNALLSKLNEPVRRTAAMRDALHMILLTGARREEMCQLQWDDIQGDRLHIRGTKNKTSDRWLPILPEMRMILDRRRFAPKNEYVFATSSGGPVQGRNLYRWMELNMPAHSVHDLRHTYGTNAARAGINPKALQMLLGHAKVETTLSYYTHMNDGDLYEAAAKINARCKSVANPDKKENKTEQEKSPETLQ